MGALAAFAGMTSAGGGDAVAADGPAALAPAASDAYLLGDWARRHGYWGVAAQQAERGLAAAPEAAPLQRQGLRAFLMTGDIAAAAGIEPNTDLPAQARLQHSLARYADALAAEAPGPALLALETLPETGIGELLAPYLRAWAASAAGDRAAENDALAAMRDSPMDADLAAYHYALLAQRRGDATGAWLGLGLLAAGDGPLAGPARADLAGLAGDGAPARAEDPALGAAAVFTQMARRLAEFDSGNWPAMLYALGQHLAPGDAEIALARGETLLSLGHARPAASLFAEIRRNADAPAIAGQARLGRARALNRLDRREDALAELEDIALAELAVAQRARVWGQRGDILQDLNRYEEAAAAYDAALAALPEAGADGRRWQLHYRRAWALDGMDKWPAAETALETALELAPEAPEVLNYLGYSWADRGKNLPRAREMLETAAAQRPEAGHIADSLGWVMYRQGEYAAAVDQLEKAARLAPTNAVVQDHLGDAYWRVGRKREARFQWQYALNVHDGGDFLDPEAVKAKLSNGLDGDD